MKICYAWYSLSLATKNSSVFVDGDRQQNTNLYKKENSNNELRVLVGLMFRPCLVVVIPSTNCVIGLFDSVAMMLVVDDKRGTRDNDTEWVICIVRWLNEWSVIWSQKQKRKKMWMHEKKTNNIKKGKNVWSVACKQSANNIVYIAPASCSYSIITMTALWVSISIIINFIIAVVWCIFTSTQRVVRLFLVSHFVTKSL